MKRLIALITILVVLLVQNNSFGQMRNWTGSNGKVIEAEFLSYDASNEIVKIRLKNSREQNVKISLFSQADQDFVRNGGKTGDNPFGEANKQLIHLRIHLDESGNGSIGVERIGDFEKTDASGTPCKLNSFHKTNVFKKENDIFTFVYDFSDADPITSWKADSLRNNQIVDDGATYDPNEKVLEVTPVEGLFPNISSSSFFYRIHFLLPYTCDLYFQENNSSNNEIWFSITGLSEFNRIVVRYLNVDKETFQIGVDIGKSWMKQENKQVFFENAAKFSRESWKKNFRLPATDIKNDARYTLTIRYDAVQGDKTPMKFKKIITTARFIPSIGASYENKNGEVLINRLFSPNEIGAQSGLLAGDVIKSIDGKAVKTVQEVEKTIAAIPLGKPFSIRIDRRGREQDINIKSN